VGIQSLGFEGFFHEVLDRLGVELTAGTTYWLAKHEKSREKKRQLQQSLEQKKKRKQLYYEALQRKTKQAKRDIERGIGYYRAAVQAADAPEPDKKRRKTSGEAQKPCRCGSITHQRVTSLQFPLNKAYTEADPLLIQELQKNQEEQAIMDTLGEHQASVARKIAGFKDDNQEN
jgi:hypothetical protein